MKPHQQKQSWEKWTRWAQQGNPSSHWTIALSGQWFVAALIVVFFAHIWFSVLLPPTEDELYYWNWSRSLQLSYYDHPPLTAYLIRFSRAIFGEGMLGIRFFACVVSTLVLGLISLTARNKQLTTLVLFLPLFFWGGVLMTPDVPLVLFWTCYVLWVQNISQTLSEWSGDPVSRVYRKSPVSAGRWILGGLILGLGLFSKYTMVLAIPCAIFALMFRYRANGWLGGFVLHLAIAGLFCIPIIYFNYQHDWVSFRFQWGHALAGVPWSFARLWDFLGGQVALVGLLPFLMLPWVILSFANVFPEPRAGTLWAFFVPLILFFLFQAIRKPLEGNWAIVAYLSFWGLAQRLLDNSSFKSLTRLLVLIGFLPALFVTGAIGMHAITPIKWIPPQKDRLRLMYAKLALSKEVGRDFAELKRDKKLYVYNYQWTSYLRYDQWNAEQIPGYGRASNYSFTASNPCDASEAYVFQPTGEQLPVLQCFTQVNNIKDYTLVVRGNVQENFSLRHYSRP